ncbi:MAG TPA: LysR family transcriptional regulator [Xanthobacteraceae bacterium]|jgi:DNA-binding transcriptional LysR family regulator|nr:LysR family transcriptional regulator [Xanthobacteraceae bacterium]
MMRRDLRIARRLKLRDLHTLVVVAERKSMAKAAAELAITQPAVTKAIAEMERTLGTRLLDRTSRGVEPTLYGRALLRWCDVVFDDLHQAVQEVEFLADPTAGELRIGAVQPMLQGLLPAILGRLSRQHPRIVFRISAARNTSDHYRDLRERRIDLLIGRITEAAKDDDLDSEHLFDESIHVVAGARNRWLRRRDVRLADLVNEPWVLPWPDIGPDSVIWPYVAEAFRKSGLDLPQSCIVSNSVPLGIAMLSAGSYLAMLPQSLIWFSGKQLGMRALPIQLPIRPPPVGIVTLRNRTVSPVAQLFIECARDVARPLR